MEHQDKNLITSFFNYLIIVSTKKRMKELQSQVERILHKAKNDNFRYVSSKVFNDRKLCTKIVKISKAMPQTSGYTSLKRLWRKSCSVKNIHNKDVYVLSLSL